MVTGDLDFKHFFVVKNGEVIYDNKEMLSFFFKRLEGKRGYLTIHEYEEDVTPNQWAYYYGGIIRAECMNSNCFAGLTDKQIHQILFTELRGKEIVVQRPDGSCYTKTVTDDFSSYGKRKMSKYIDELISHLNVTWNIYPKDPKYYKGYNKMVITQKAIERPNSDSVQEKDQKPPGW